MQLLKVFLRKFPIIMLPVIILFQIIGFAGGFVDMVKLHPLEGVNMTLGMKLQQGGAIVAATGVAPGAKLEDHFVRMSPRYGFSNRIAALLATIWIVENSYPKNTVLLVDWYLSPYCTDHFLAMFRPLHNVVFLDPDTEKAFQSMPEIPFYSARFAGFIQYFAKAHSSSAFGEVSNLAGNATALAQAEVDMVGRLRLVDTLENLVSDYLRKHNVCMSCAVHIRNTEVYAGADLHQYFRFLNSSSCAGKPFFVMTDNSTTQATMLQRYGSRMQYYKIVSPVTITNKRPTTLFDAMVEAYITARSIAFLGSISTFSKFVSDLRQALRPTVCT